MDNVTDTQKPCKAFFATLYDEHGILIKINGIIHFFRTADAAIIDYEPDMAPWVTILGDVDICDAQLMKDRLAGGYARIACTRPQEVR
jgi:hypothetical protein